MTKAMKMRNLSIFTAILICLSILIGVGFNSFGYLIAAAADAGNTDFVYLSDLDYDSSQSSVGWREILKDKTVNDTKITVKIEGAWYAFDKGIFSHAPATILYDISNYSYNYFTAYTGLDKLITTKSDGVKFFVYTSEDGTNWNLKSSANPTLLGIAAEAEFLSVDISGANYLKLVVDQNKHNGADYAVWADAKLTNSPSGDGTVQSLEYYDNQIKAKGTTNIETDKELELLVLQREFVRKAGQYALKRFTSENSNNMVVLDWLLNDVDNLREFMLGGAPMQGNYYNALTVLSDLYRNYKSDLDNKTLLNNKWAPERTYGELYRTMMFAVALTHDGVVGSWLQKERVENQSDPLRRYAIFRYLHNTDRFIATRNEDGTAKFETASLFESLTVEEMRWIMFNIIDDESIIWLNDYVQTKINANPTSVGGLHTPHSYIAYTNPNYGNPVFYAEENRDYFNELFAVDDRNNAGQKIGMWDTSYTIPGGEDHETYTLEITRGTESDKVIKVWMNFRNKFGTGSVCGGISKSGTNIRTARGIPSTVIGQPGHAAILYYTKNSEGKGYWSIDNNVGGWTVATKGERHLLGWGNETWQRTHPTVVYYHLAQDALNDYDSYVQAEENIMLARVYQGDLAKQEALYEKALSIQPINIDAWYGLIQTYKAKNVNSDKFIALAKRIADIMVGYPLPMYNLLNVIKPELTTVEAVYEYTLVENRALLASSVLPNTATDKTLIPSAARVEALYLLGNVDTSVAEFSFDGENAGSIVWSSRFDNTGIHWKYCLDYGLGAERRTWKDVVFDADEPHILKLTPAEIASITEENDIYIHIYGINESEANYFKIDISSKPTVPNTLYSNDYENKILGLDERFEWRYQGINDWTSYAEAVPDCTGNKTVEVRIKASGGNPPSDVTTFTFNEDADNENKKYVSVSHLTIEGFSSESKDGRRPNYAVNAIDGNVNTYWHTDYAENVLTSGNTPYLIVKLDTPKYISGVDFAQYQYNANINIFAKNVKVYVSEDNENWTEAGTLEDLEAMDDIKSVDFAESILGQYIKIEFETYGIFTTVSMLNVYEDVTKLDPDDNKPDNPVEPVDPNKPDDGTTSKPQKNSDIVKIVVPIVVVVVLAAAGAAVAIILVKRKKANSGGSDNNAPDDNGSDKTELDNAASDKPSTAKKAASDKPTSDNPSTAKKPASEKPSTAKKPASDKPASDKPSTAKKTASDKPASDKPSTAKKTASDKPASDKPSTAKKATSDKPASDKPSTAKKTVLDKPASDKPSTTKKAASDKTVSKKSNSDKK